MAFLAYKSASTPGSQGVKKVLLHSIVRITYSDIRQFILIDELERITNFDNRASVLFYSISNQSSSETECPLVSSEWLNRITLLLPS